jgi:hypothetical protein
VPAADVGGVRRRLRLRVYGKDVVRWAAATGHPIRVGGTGEVSTPWPGVRRKVHGRTLRLPGAVRCRAQDRGCHPRRAAAAPGAAETCGSQEPHSVPHLQRNEDDGRAWWRRI